MITSTKSKMGQVTQLKRQWIIKVKVLGEISQKIAKVKVFEQNTNLRKEKNTISRFFQRRQRESDIRRVGNIRQIILADIG